MELRAPRYLELFQGAQAHGYRAQRSMKVVRQEPSGKLQAEEQQRAVVVVAPVESAPALRPYFPNPVHP